MLTTDVVVVGGGSAGLAAAIESSKAGAEVLLIDENARPGGQLFKQIHKFFGSRRHYAGIRGFEIGRRLLEEAHKNEVEIKLNTIIFGILGNKIGIVEDKTHAKWLKAKTIIFSCGASEKLISFPGWTLPGVMGAGAAQTIINLHRVLPGSRFLMIGSGNVGLVVSYQILQAGAEVVAIIEALPKIGGYGIHASKIRRAGVQIAVSHTIKEAYGKDKVEAVTIGALDKNMNLVPGSEKRFKVDVICLAVGLKPNIELPLMAGCETMFLANLGGQVPIHDENMETTVEGIYVAGDCAGIEEVSTAIESGRLAGIAVAEKLGYLTKNEAYDVKVNLREVLDELRGGPFGMQRKYAKQQLIRRAAHLKGV
ncbi:MAG: FAD-dependent oxidoreductase [Candidatus Bathyarchaeota archaeon]|nr:MAG: FAD-dependent oxidoreductase [Candidatus Bathyarchaeota archaeon]